MTGRMLSGNSGSDGRWSGEGVGGRMAPPELELGVRRTTVEHRRPEVQSRSDTHSRSPESQFLLLRARLQYVISK